MISIMVINARTIITFKADNIISLLKFMKIHKSSLIWLKMKTRNLKSMKKLKMELIKFNLKTCNWMTQSVQREAYLEREIERASMLSSQKKVPLNVLIVLNNLNLKQSFAGNVGMLWKYQRNNRNKTRLR